MEQCQVNHCLTDTCTQCDDFAILIDHHTNWFYTSENMCIKDRCLVGTCTDCDTEDNWRYGFQTEYSSQAECQETECHSCSKCDLLFDEQLQPGTADVVFADIEQCKNVLCKHSVCPLCDGTVSRWKQVLNSLGGHFDSEQECELELCIGAEACGVECEGIDWVTADSGAYSTQFECLFEKCPEVTCPTCHGEDGSGFETVIDPESYFVEHTDHTGVYGVPAYFADVTTCAKSTCLEYNPCSMCQTHFASAFHTRYSSADECASYQCNKCSNCEDKFDSHFTTRYPNATTCAEDHCAKWTCAYCDTTLEKWLENLTNKTGSDEIATGIEDGSIGTSVSYPYDAGESSDKWFYQAQCKDAICNNCTDCVDHFQSAFRTEYSDEATCRAAECPETCNRCKYEWDVMVDPKSKTAYADLDHCMMDHCSLLLASTCSRDDGRQGFMPRRYNLTTSSSTDKYGGTAASIAWTDGGDYPLPDFLQCFEDLGGIMSNRWDGNSSDPFYEAGEFWECSWCDHIPTFFDQNADDCRDQFCDETNVIPGGQGSRPSVQSPVDHCGLTRADGETMLHRKFNVPGECYAYYEFDQLCPFELTMNSVGDQTLQSCVSCQACMYNWHQLPKKLDVSVINLDGTSG